MSNVALGSRKKNILKQPRASPFWQGSRLLGDLRGLKGRPRCLTSLLDPVKKPKHILMRDLRGLRGLTGRP